MRVSAAATAGDMAVVLTAISFLFQGKAPDFVKVFD
jgi:hypothetical protein